MPTILRIRNIQEFLAVVSEQSRQNSLPCGAHSSMGSMEGSVEIMWKVDGMILERQLLPVSLWGRVLWRTCSGNKIISQACILILRVLFSFPSLASLATPMDASYYAWRFYSTCLVYRVSNLWLLWKWLLGNFFFRFEDMVIEWLFLIQGA